MADLPGGQGAVLAMRSWECLHWALVNEQKEQGDEIFKRSHLFSLKDSMFAFHFTFWICV